MAKLSEDQKFPYGGVNKTVFYPNECFICKATGSLKRCSRCTMISYCGKQHQMQHWKLHKDICKVISDMIQQRGLNYLYENYRNSNSVEWRNAKVKMLDEAKRKLQRDLETYEEQMFQFPKACFVCHDSKQEILKSCPRCTNANFCQKHPSSPLHDQDCSQIQQCHKIDIEFGTATPKVELYKPIITNIPFITSKSQTVPKTITEYVEKIQIPKKLDNKSKILMEELLCIPLTIFNALQKLNQLSPSKLLIHIDCFQEEHAFTIWEVLFHLIPQLTYLKIVICDSKLDWNIKRKLCDKCRKKKKKLCVVPINMPYNQFPDCADYDEPDLLLLANVSLPEENEIFKRIWYMQVFIWGIVRCPLVILGISEKAISVFCESMRSFYNGVLVCYQGVNNFGPSNPSRDWETEGITRLYNQMLIMKIIHENTYAICNRCGISHRSADSKTSECAFCSTDFLSSDAVLFPKKNKNRHRTFFYPYACHVCNSGPIANSIEGPPPLKSCNECKMIFYCHDIHEFEDQPAHIDLCKVISKMLKESGSSNLFENLDKTNVYTWTKGKVSLILKVQEELGRKLLDFEREMFLFPKVCLECFESDLSVLKSCRCGNSFCDTHQKTPHDEASCDLSFLSFDLERCLIAIRRKTAPIATMEVIFRSSREDIFEFIPLITDVKEMPKTMDNFIKLYIHVNSRGKSMLTTLKQFLFSELFTKPLTCFYSLQKLELWLESMVVHILGVNDDDKSESGYWEVLLHLVPNLKNLTVVFIDPEISELDLVKVKVCNCCLENGKSLNVKGVGLKYENYFLTDSFENPDIVMAYNIRLFESRFEFSESWTESILTLGNLDAAFVLTGVEDSVIKLDMKLINHIFGSSSIPYIYTGTNPFHTDIPRREPSNQRIRYRNSYLIIYPRLNAFLVAETDQNQDSTPNLSNGNSTWEAKSESLISKFQSTDNSESQTIIIKNVGVKKRVKEKID